MTTACTKEKVNQINQKKIEQLKGKVRCYDAIKKGMAHGTKNIPFEENMVLDIEVWLNVIGQGLVGVEDCYRITNSGCEALSHLNKEIVVK